MTKILKPLVWLTFLLLSACSQNLSQPKVYQPTVQPVAMTADHRQLQQRLSMLPQILGWQEWDRLWEVQSNDQRLLVVPLEAEDEARFILIDLDQTSVSVCILGFGVAEEAGDPDFSGWLWLYDLETGMRNLSRRYVSGVLTSSDLPPSDSRLLLPLTANQDCLVTSTVAPPPLPANFYQLEWQTRLERLAPYLLSLTDCW